MKLLKKYWWLFAGAVVLFAAVEKLPELKLPEPVNKINDVVYKFHGWLRKTVFNLLAVLTVPDRAGALQHRHNSGSWGDAK